MEYLELSVPVLVTTVAVLLAWFLVKRRQNSLVLSEEPAVKEKVENECEGKEEEPFDLMATREKLASFLLDSKDLTYLDGEPAQDELPNIHTYYKKSRLKIPEMEKMLTEDELEDERNTQRKQLEDIFKMMEQNKEQYGMDSFEELEDQMKLYSFK